MGRVEEVLDRFCSPEAVSLKQCLQGQAACCGQDFHTFRIYCICVQGGESVLPEEITSKLPTSTMVGKWKCSHGSSLVFV